MVHLNLFMKVLEENSDMAFLVEQISAGKLTVPSPQDIQTHLASLPEDERNKVQTLLVNTIESLTGYTNQLEMDKEETRKQMDRNLDSRKACQSYETRQGGGGKNKK
jgi:hypothetical protein